MYVICTYLYCLAILLQGKIVGWKIVADSVLILIQLVMLDTPQFV